MPMGGLLLSDMIKRDGRLSVVLKEGGEEEWEERRGAEEERVVK